MATAPHTASTAKRSSVYGRTRSRQPRGVNHLSQFEPVPSEIWSALTRITKASASITMDRPLAWPT